MSGRKKGFRILDGRVVTLAALIVLLVAAMSLILKGAFLSSSNFSGILTSMAFDLLLSCGMTVVLILGGVDLSVGSVVAMVGIIVSQLVKAGAPVFAVVLLGLVIGLIVGGINGVLVSKAGLAPFVATLGTNSIIRGGCYVATSG